MKQIRVIVVDDHELVREGIRNILQDANQGIEVVGTACDGRTALAMVASLKPDVVLMDVRMPGMDGITALRAMREVQQELGVIILTTFDDEQYVVDAVQYGASAYLLKDAPLEDLIRTIQTVVRGGTTFSPQVTKIVRSRMGGGQNQPPQPPDRQATGSYVFSRKDASLLSEREMEILHLVAECFTNQEISARLHLTEGTVRNYVSRIYMKLGARDRTHALIIARKLRLIADSVDEP